MGTLYVVATPIGNLEDITLRALRILREVRLIAAEDTRTAHKLLARYEIHTPTTSYFEHNEVVKAPRLLRELEQGDLALISEAGMPGLSDPGAELIGAALAAGYPVVPIPGPSAITTAVAVSGLPAEGFLYLGFLPRRGKERRALLQNVSAEPYTLVFFEAPHRVLESLEDMQEILGDRRIAAARELTKLYEDVWRGTISGLRAHLAAGDTRGEFTLVVAGAQPPTVGPWTEEQVRAAVAARLQEGTPARAAAKEIAAAAGWRVRDIYDIYTMLKADQARE